WSIAFSARLALKWMSAMMGTGEKRTIFESASASSVFGTATRTISQPALASAAICAVVASTSCVFVVVIDCTTTGAPPPIRTPPTVTERWLATGSGYRGWSDRNVSPMLGLVRGRGVIVLVVAVLAGTGAALASPGGDVAKVVL